MVLAILYAVVLPAALFCIPNIIIDFFLIFWAQRKLSEDFRATAVRSLGFTPVRMLWIPSGRPLAGLRQPPVIRQ
jgi:hypothetical protein